jgi:hypothetical protein
MDPLDESRHLLAGAGTATEVQLAAYVPQEQHSHGVVVGAADSRMDVAGVRAPTVTVLPEPTVA